MKFAKPVRLRLSRHAGFDLQKLSRKTNGLPAVVVCRPSRWGNPYTVKEYDRARAITLYKKHLAEAARKTGRSKLDPTELMGKNLACWCKPEELCHADVLLERANK